MKTRTIVICWVFSIICTSFLSGLIVYQYFNKPGPFPPIDIPATPVVSKPVERPTENITLQEAIGIIHCYDTSEIKINWRVLEQKKTEMKVGITGNLCEREFSQEQTLPIFQTSSGNWKLGLGVVIGAAAAVGTVYGTYRLIQLFK